MGRALLILVSGLVIIYGIVQKSIYDRYEDSGTLERGSEYAYWEQGKNANTAMIDYVIERIRFNQRNNKSWRNGLSGGQFMRTNFLGSDSVIFRGYDQGDVGTSDYPAYTSVGQTQDGWNQFRILLTSEARLNGEVMRTEVLMQRDSFSRYSYFTNVEPNGIYFFTNDVLTGPVHTNGTFQMAGTPTFNGAVTSPNDWVGRSGDRSSSDPDDRHGNETPQFNAETDFDADAVPLPGNDDKQFDQLATAAGSRGMRFDNHIRVYFDKQGNNEGTVTVQEYRGNGNWVEQTFTKNQYDGGVISSSERIDIRGGTLDGQLTLYSEGEIEIDSDIRYAVDPADSTQKSTDLLGIVSKSSVNIDRWAHSDKRTDNGNNDITIHASIMALESFYVEKYEDGNPRGKIHLLGGVIQQNRGAVGTFSGNGIASGYSKDYKYDERLLTSVPPFFPRESQFDIFYWKDNTTFTRK